MASNRPRILAVSQVNRPKLPPKPSIKRLSSEELSSRNSKRPIVSSHIGDGSEDPDEIFRPWRSLSNPLDNATKENEEVEILSNLSQMKVYQALSAEPNSARAFITCPIARRELWLRVKFGDEFMM